MQKKRDRCCDLSPRNGIAPRAALLTARWGDERRRKAPAYLFSEAVRTFTGLL